MEAWKETLLAGRFSAPTSAGVLFSMLAAAGLSTTWLFRKARILAIFDDLDTVLLMIPLKILLVGFAWQLGLAVVIMAALIFIAYYWLHQIPLPVTWRWVLFYSTVIVGLSELFYAASKIVDPSVPIHIEVLLPAFVLGCVARPIQVARAANPKFVERALHKLLARGEEKRAATWISAAFMMLVGLSMPTIFGGADLEHPAPSTASMEAAAPTTPVAPAQQSIQASTVTGSQPSMGWEMIAVHVLLLTLLSNLGKMFPALCYRREAHWRHRLGLAIGMWPRGEVGAGVLVLSLSYGIGGPVVTVAMISLALNLALTGIFIVFVKKLIAGVPESAPTSLAPATVGAGGIACIRSIS